MSKMSIYALSGKIFGQKSASVKSLTNFMSDNFVSFFQPRTEMRGEFLEIVQDRLQGDAFQLHTQTVPHSPHKGAKITMN